MSKEVLQQFNLPNKPKFCEHIENGMKFDFGIKYAFEQTLKEFTEKQNEAILKFLYERYKDTDISKVYVLSRPEFEKFLIEMLPKWRRKDDDLDPRHKKLHGKDYYNFIIDEANEFLNEQEQGKRLRLQDQDYVWANVDTLKDCIDLLSTDGKGTKQQVKQKLEELLK